VIVAIVVHAVPRWVLGGIPDRRIAVYSGASALIAAASVFVYFGTIRCPTCGANWMWRAMRQRVTRWLEWFQEQQVCPVCGSSGDPYPGHRRRGP
jgi:hypothetical protein